MLGLRQQPPAAWVGILTAALLITVVTLVVLLTAAACAIAFNFFHLPPTGTFAIHDSGNVTALIAFLVVAAAVIAVAQLAQRRALEAERRRAETDLAAQAARVLLGEGDLE